MAARLIWQRFLALIAAALAAGRSPLPPPVTQIFLMRHGERAAGDDPVLTAEGKRRAAAPAERRKVAA